MREVVYDTQEKVRAYWEFCDKLRQLGVTAKTGDSELVATIERALKVHKSWTEKVSLGYIFKKYKERLGIFEREPIRSIIYKPNTHVFLSPGKYIREIHPEVNIGIITGAEYGVMLARFEFTKDPYKIYWGKRIVSIGSMGDFQLEIGARLPIEHWLDDPSLINNGCLKVLYFASLAGIQCELEGQRIIPIITWGQLPSQKEKSVKANRISAGPPKKG